MEFENYPRRITSLFQIVEDFLLDLTRVRSHSHRVPNLYKKRFKIIWKPIAFIVCVFDSHQNIFVRNNSPFRDSLYNHRQTTAVLFENVFPSSAVEASSWRKMCKSDILSLLYFFCSDQTSGKMFLQEVLKSEEYGLWVFAT